MVSWLGATHSSTSLFLLQVALTVEFPEVWPEVMLSGSVLKAKDSQVRLDITTPSLKHQLHGRLVFGQCSTASVYK